MNAFAKVTLSCVFADVASEKTFGFYLAFLFYLTFKKKKKKGSFQFQSFWWEYFSMDRFADVSVSLVKKASGM